MNIRKYSPKDQEGIEKIQLEFMNEFFPEFLNDPRRKEWEYDLKNIKTEYFDTGGHFWVIETENKLIGFGGIQIKAPNKAEIERVRLLSNFRGKGLGHRLLETIEAYCIQKNIKKILVDTDTRLEIAKKMYLNNGYQIYKETEEIIDGQSYYNLFFIKEFI